MGKVNTVFTGNQITLSEFEAESGPWRTTSRTDYVIPAPLVINDMIVSEGLTVDDIVQNGLPIYLGFGGTLGNGPSSVQAEFSTNSETGNIRISLGFGYQGLGLDGEAVLDGNIPIVEALLNPISVSGFSGIKIVYGELGEFAGFTFTHDGMPGQASEVRLGFFLDESGSIDFGGNLKFTQGLGIGKITSDAGFTYNFIEGGRLTIDDLKTLADAADPNLWEALKHVDENVLLLNFGGNLTFELLKEFGRECFGPEVSINMWQLDSELSSDPNGILGQDYLPTKTQLKPIKDIIPGDIVVSFDKDGSRVPGTVTRIFTKDVKIVLDFFGTGVTPGHVYYRADGAKPSTYETLIDILRFDGVIEKQDGTQIRAATGMSLDDPRDGFVWAVTGAQTDDGSV
ncbi:MAG: hypothetical protein AAF922_07875 [Pseudomonadota bacterium]